ncbi:MAG: aminopeptidase, partial [Lachnospiraceae bacterium]|nr:aminopeptidase [Lachnospiraceae bacterium]
MERENAWKKYPAGKKRQAVMDYAEGYRKFLSECKTERECNDYFVKEALANGFKNLEDVIAGNKKLKAGDKVLLSNYGKGLAMFVIGKEPLE